MGLRKRYTPEQIIGFLREAEVSLAQDRTIGQHRSTQRKLPQGRPDEDALTRSIFALASEYGRFG